MSIKLISKQSWAAFNAGDYDQAIDSLSPAATMGYSQNYIDYMASFAHFAKADFRRAFQGFSHRREVMKDSFSKYPDWSAETPHKPTLIWAPPGLGIGAEVMHLGFMQNIKPYAETYSLAVDPRLVYRLRKMHPWANIIARGNETKILTDDHCVATLLSLGHITYSIAKVPVQRGRKILGASSVSVKNIRQELLSKEGECLIGLSWRSANNNLNSRDYTLQEVHRFANNLFATSSKKPIYVSLQHKMNEAEEHICKALKIKVISPHRISANISEFLDIISACDNGISAANSVIHLAGALGKKFVLIKKSDCPWEWRPPASEKFWYSKITFADI